MKTLRHTIEFTVMLMATLIAWSVAYLSSIGVIVIA